MYVRCQRKFKLNVFRWKRAALELAQPSTCNVVILKARLMFFFPFLTSFMWAAARCLLYLPDHATAPEFVKLERLEMYPKLAGRRDMREKFHSDAQLSFFDIGARTRFFLPVLICCFSSLFLFSSSEIVWLRVQVLLHFLWQEALIDYTSPIAEYSFQNASVPCPWSKRASDINFLI